MTLTLHLTTRSLSWTFSKTFNKSIYPTVSYIHLKKKFLVVYMTFSYAATFPNSVTRSWKDGDPGDRQPHIINCLHIMILIWIHSVISTSEPKRWVSKDINTRTEWEATFCHILNIVMNQNSCILEQDQRACIRSPSSVSHRQHSAESFRTSLNSLHSIF